MNNGIDAMRRASGGFTMLALDQRESLRQMMQVGKGKEVRDGDIVDFKVSALEIFSTKPSAILVDIEFGIPAFQRVRSDLSPVILAVDELGHGGDGRVAFTQLVTSGVESAIQDCAPVALKFLMLWSKKESAAQRLDLAGSFVDLCKTFELPSVLEAIVRPPSDVAWSEPRMAAEAMVQAALELSTVKPDLYKCEVPGHGRFENEETVAYSEEITRAIGSPWVVLSNGVSAEDFPHSVAAACVGGASGFLAGRAIWADAVQSEDPKDFMKSQSLHRMNALITIVDEAMASRHTPETSAE
jgi:sulfofructosephosphate aldolase